MTEVLSKRPGGGAAGTGQQALPVVPLVLGAQAMAV